MEQDLLHDWDDTPEDEKRALDVISSHHHMIYQLLYTNIQQNIGIVREYCVVPPYHEQQIISAPTVKESNKRLLKFIEDRYSLTCEYDEFFVILRKLIEMPEALKIVDTYQRMINDCFKERREKEKLFQKENEATQVTKTTTTTSSTVGGIEQKTSPHSAHNGLHAQHHQPSASPTTEGENGDTGMDDTQEMSAKSIVSSVVTEVLHSTPGYHILENYKERLCECLPADYKNTALRLQTLIGATDHMIQWILSGEMSKVNHRIYQVVLVYVCFEPHFIKFCDIMEVLAAGSMTIRYIVELRENLIKHLYSDEHITAEKASQLTSKKLFEAPAPPTATAPPTDPGSNAASSSAAVAPAVTHASTIDKITAVFKHLLRDLSTSTTEPSVVTVANALSAEPLSLSQPSNPQLRPIKSDSQPSITVTPNTPMASSVTASNMFKQNGPPGSVTTASTTVVPTTAVLLAPVHKAAVVTPSGTAQPDNLAIGDDLSQPTSSAVSDVSSNEDQSYYHDLEYDETADPVNDNTANGSTTKARKKPDTRKLVATATPRGSSPVASLKLHSVTPSDKDVKRVTIELTKAMPNSGTSGQLSIDRIMDSVVDENLLTLDGIAQFLLSSPSEKSVMLMEMVNRLKEKSTGVSAQAQEFGGHKVATEMHRSPGLELLRAKYTRILACFPENYGTTIQCLQNYLGDSEVAEIVSLSSGHNQKILDCLIRKVKRDEDLLDFCEVLDKISGAPPLLKLIVEQIRKEVIEKLQMMSSPIKSDLALGDLNMASMPVVSVPQAQITPPEIIDPFNSCSLPQDSKVLAILKQYYPSLLKSLSSNHMTTLTRLKDVATLPEDQLDSFKTAPNSDVGNELIMSYLIGLIQTEDDINEFCNMVEKMIGGDPSKCECVTQLRNAVVSVQQQHEEKIFTVKEEDINNKPASSSCDADIPSPIKTVETNNTALPSDSDLKKSQQCSEDGDMELEVDKSAEPSGDGKSVTSDKNAKEYSAVTSQAVTSTEATLPGPKLNSDTQAALKAFNAYRPQLQALDAFEVGKQLINYRLMSRKGGTHSGEAIFLPNELKMSLILPEIERNISLNGPKVLLLLVSALSEIPSCVELSSQLNDAYEGYRCSSGPVIIPQTNLGTHLGIGDVSSQNMLPQTTITASTTMSLPTSSTTPIPSTAVGKQESAFVKCTEETAAVMATFDEYSSLIQENIDPFVFIPRCVSYEILRGDITAEVGGGATFLTNQKRMEIVVRELRSIVFEKGIEVFKKILYVLRREPIYVRVADHIESVYEIYKDPVARQKYEQRLAEEEAKKSPATDTDPIDTQAALEVFDEYYECIHHDVEVDMFTSKCVGYGVIPEISPITGASIFLPDYLKMDIVLPMIRKNIALNGRSIFELMARVFESMGEYHLLSIKIKKTFKEKQQAIRAQQSQQVVTETTAVATTSNTTLVISEANMSASSINQLANLDAQKLPIANTATTTAETFKEKQQAIRAQQSQQVATETTAVATTSNTTPVISEANMSTSSINQLANLDAQKLPITSTATTTAGTVNTPVMNQQFRVNRRKPPIVTSSIPGESSEDRIKRLKAKVAANKAAEAAAQQEQLQQQQQSIPLSVQQSADISVAKNPKVEPNIDHLIEKGLQPPSLPQNYVCRPKLLDELVQKMLSNKPDPSILSVAAIITGPSGFGKTTLAKALCHNPQIMKSFQDGFIFVELGPKAINPVSSLNKLCSHLTGKKLELDSLESLVMELRQITGAYFHNLLVILDDVCEANDAVPYVKAFSNCSVVLTTQLDGIGQAVSAEIELKVSKMEMDESVALINGACIEKNDVSTAITGLAEDLHCWPLLLCLAKCHVDHFQKQQEAPTDGDISLTRKKLQEKNLNQPANEDQRKRTAVKACVDLSLEMAGDSLKEKLIMYVLFTGIGYSLSTAVVHLLWQISESDAEQVIQSLSSCGLISVKTSRFKDTTNVVMHTVIAQCLLDCINASKILQLGLYQGPNAMSIDIAVSDTYSVSLPSDDHECLKVILDIIDYSELPCRLRRLSSAVIKGPTSLISIIQGFYDQSFGLPEYEGIKDKFQTSTKLIDECKETLAITVQSAITLSTELYKYIQANSHNSLVKNVEIFCQNKVIREIGSNFFSTLNELMPMEEDDLYKEVQKAMEQIKTFEEDCKSVVIEFAQIKLVVELREKITGALMSGIDAQISKACQHVRSGELAEKLAKTKEFHQSKLKET